MSRSKNTLARKIMLISLGILTIIGCGAIGTSFAGFVASAVVKKNNVTPEEAQPIGTEGYKLTTIFLDPRYGDGSGETWNKDGAVIFLWAWNSATPSVKNFYRAVNDSTNASGYFFFHIPSAKYTHVLFARANPSAITEGISWATLSDWRWNQTTDMPLYYGSSTQDGVIKPYDYNLCKITDGTGTQNAAEWQANYHPY